MNRKLAHALRSLINEKRRPIPVSSLFIQHLCRNEVLTAEVTTWFNRRRIHIEHTSLDEFTFTAHAVPQPRRGEFVGSLFADCP